jgi:RNA polymerase sigma-70 factor, ECF subfamily
VQTNNSRLDPRILNGAKQVLTRAGESHGVSAEVLAERIQKSLEKYLLKYVPEPSEREVSEFIDGLHADDLCLIIACEQGSETAWNELVTRFMATVRSAARGVAGSEDAAEDLAQSIWAELYGLKSRDGRASGKIGYYSGRGSLGGWLRAVVGQMAVDHHRKMARFVQSEEEADLDRWSNDSDNEPVAVALAVGNPELDFVAQTGAADVGSALTTAVEELAVEDRLLLKLYYLDGLKLREAGALLGVHEATASRRVSRVQQQIRKRVERLLRDRKGWTEAEVARGLSDHASRLETDLEALLAPETARSKGVESRGP